MRCFIRDTPPYQAKHYVPVKIDGGGQQIAFGTNATVFAVGNDKVLKLQSLKRAPVNDEEDPVEAYATYECSRDSIGEFLDEATLATLFGDLGIGPRVHKVWICEDSYVTYVGENNTQVTLSDVTGLILMDWVVGETIESYAKHYPALFREKFTEIKQLLHDKLQHIAALGYVGFDLVMSNVMLKFKTPDVIEDLVVIDFDGYKKRPCSDIMMKFALKELKNLQKKRRRKR
jgi:hypothetical protein